MTLADTGNFEPSADCIERTFAVLFTPAFHRAEGFALESCGAAALELAIYETNVKGCIVRDHKVGSKKPRDFGREGAKRILMTQQPVRVAVHGGRSGVTRTPWIENQMYIAKRKCRLSFQTASSDPDRPKANDAIMLAEASRLDVNESNRVR